MPARGVAVQEQSARLEGVPDEARRHGRPGEARASQHGPEPDAFPDTASDSDPEPDRPAGRTAVAHAVGAAHTRRSRGAGNPQVVRHRAVRGLAGAVAEGTPDLLPLLTARMETAPALLWGAGAVHPHGSSAGADGQATACHSPNGDTARRVTPPNGRKPVRRSGPLRTRG
ncbi:protein of unknown function [Streptomyces sp. KY75]|nr:protein of unknown function [Streptomyces sp. KY70]CAD5993384.1 protein of unknown function [Streptomyces sp. KY75]